MRKTIEVSVIRDRSNRYAESEHTTAQERLAVFHLAASVLSETGNYRGFSYVDQRWDEDAGEMYIPDESRRRLY